MKLHITYRLELAEIADALDLPYEQVASALADAIGQARDRIDLP